LDAITTLLHPKQQKGVKLAPLYRCKTESSLSHSKLVQTRRRQASAKKDADREAKQAKKLANAAKAPPKAAKPPKPPKPPKAPKVAKQKAAEPEKAAKPPKPPKAAKPAADA